MVSSDFESFFRKSFFCLKRTNFWQKFTARQVSLIFFEFLLILRQFWPINFKTWMVSQQLKNKKLKPLECPSVPGGRSGAKSGARSAQQRLGRPACHPKGFKFLFFNCCETIQVLKFVGQNRYKINKNSKKINETWHAVNFFQKLVLFRQKNFS